MLGTVSAFYEQDAVIMAAGITAAVTIGLTLFAFQTKWDFTTCGGRHSLSPYRAGLIGCCNAWAWLIIICQFLTTH